jgi:hypothetical protein
MGQFSLDQRKFSMITISQLPTVGYNNLAIRENRHSPYLWRDFAIGPRLIAGFFHRLDRHFHVSPSVKYFGGLLSHLPMFFNNPETTICQRSTSKSSKLPPFVECKKRNLHQFSSSRISNTSGPKKNGPLAALFLHVHAKSCEIS